MDQNGSGGCILQPQDTGAPSYIVFVTSALTGDVGVPNNPNDGPLSGADDECNKLAVAANLQGGMDKKFRAWLSDDVLNTIDAIDRISNGPFLLVDGTPIADSLALLADGNIDNPIELTEWKKAPAVSSAWTGTSPFGIEESGFTSNGFAGATGADFGEDGLTSTNDGRWTANGSLKCS